MRKPPLRVPGFRATGLHCGIKDEAPDLALIASDVPAHWAGVFTRSSVVGAPVEWSRRCMRRARGRAVVVNSGISNVAMGERGRRDAAEMAELAADALDVESAEVAVASTGVIGAPLPMAKLRRGIPLAAGRLRESGLRAAARAILTTDTRVKTSLVKARVAGRTIHIAGLAKGSGMIEPNMATMLAFVLTDAAVLARVLRPMLRAACDPTFNRLTIDGETSTSDSVLLLANGVAGNRSIASASSAAGRAFAAALARVCEDLVVQLARDGEGATRLVTVEVTGARNAAEAERAARRIANSALVKTAVFGGDPNWGRLLQTVGAARVAVRLDRAEVRVGGVTVFRHGSPTGPAARRRAEAAHRRREVPIQVHLGAGRAADRLFTCDLSYDYVRINAEYTT